MLQHCMRHFYIQWEREFVLAGFSGSPRVVPRTLATLFVIARTVAEVADVVDHLDPPTPPHTMRKWIYSRNVFWTPPDTFRGRWQHGFSSHEGWSNCLIL